MAARPYLVALPLAGLVASCSVAPPVRSSARNDASNPAAPAMTTPSANAFAASPPPGSAASAAPVVYACPMHPEVVRDRPGTCPKCGMALVARPASGDR